MDKIEQSTDKKQKNQKKVVMILFLFIIISLVVAFIVISPGIMNKQAKNKNFKDFTLSDYSNQDFVFRKISFTKYLIYGTTGGTAQTDSLIIYFVQGTATISFNGFNNLSVDEDNTDYVNKKLSLIYTPSADDPELPIDVVIDIDEGKSKLVDVIQPEELGKDNIITKTMQCITASAAGALGAAAGKQVGKLLFGKKGQIIGAISGAAIAATGAYLISGNYFSKLKLVEDNKCSDIVNIMEQAKPIIATQLVYEKDINDNSEVVESYRQAITDSLKNIIIQNSKWEDVQIAFPKQNQPGESK